MSVIDELFALLDEIGATPTLFGMPITVCELKTFAWASFVDRHARYIVTQALRAKILPKESPWNPYP